MIYLHFFLCGYSTDGDSSKHGPEEIITIRYGKEEYNFITTGQAYQHECLGDFETKD